MICTAFKVTVLHERLDCFFFLSERRTWVRMKVTEARVVH